MQTNDKRPTRRTMLATGLRAAAIAGLPSRRVFGQSIVKEFKFIAGRSRARLVGDGSGETDVCAFDEKVPGPEIRVQQGDRLRVLIENKLTEDTTVHRHGIRLPNAMDGVPHLTQKPIPVGGTFEYTFDLPDAGTYWYHPHFRSSEQVGRGLYGPLIIEDRDPIKVDRGVTWMLDDCNRVVRDHSLHPGDVVNSLLTANEVQGAKKHESASCHNRDI